MNAEGQNKDVQYPSFQCSFSSTTLNVLKHFFVYSGLVARAVGTNMIADPENVSRNSCLNIY